MVHVGGIIFQEVFDNYSVCDNRGHLAKAKAGKDSPRASRTHASYCKALDSVFVGSRFGGSLCYVLEYLVFLRGAPG